MAFDVPDVSQFLGILSYLAILLGIPLVVMQIRQSNRLREGQVVVNVMRSLGESEILRYWTMLSSSPYKTYEDVLKEPDASKRDEFMTALNKLVITFEGLGIIVRRGIVPLGVIDDFVHGLTRETWLRAEPIIQGYRKATLHSESAEWWEYLYLRMHSNLSDKQALAFVTRNREARMKLPPGAGAE